MTNRPKRFQNSYTFKTGLLNFDKTFFTGWEISFNNTTPSLKLSQIEILQKHDLKRTGVSKTVSHSFKLSYSNKPKIYTSKPSTFHE